MTTEKERADARDKFVDQYRHLLLGLLTHAIIAGKQGHVEMYLQFALEKCDALLAKCFDAANPQKANQPTQPARK